MSQFTEAFDRQQAFSAGFALAAKDWGLTGDEYQAFCKTAAEMLNAPAAPPAPAAPAAAAPAPVAPVVPITDAKQADQVKVDNFVAQKAQALQGQPQPQQKAAADAGKKPAPAPVAPKPVAPAPPAPPAYNAGPQTPPGVSAFSPQANSQARNAALRKSLSKKDYVRRMALEQVADLEIDTGLAPPTAAAAQQQEAAKRQQTQATPKPPVAPPAPAAPAPSGRGALAPALAKFMKNPSL